LDARISRWSLTFAAETVEVEALGGDAPLAQFEDRNPLGDAGLRLEEAFDDDMATVVPDDHEMGAEAATAGIALVLRDMRLSADERLGATRCKVGDIVGEAIAVDDPVTPVEGGDPAGD
jgi:hypothetical protein